MMFSKRDRLERAFERLPKPLREELREMGGDAVAKCDPYYSRIRIPVTTVVVGGGTHTLTIPKQSLTCFDYAIGDPMTNAGFPAAAPYDKATLADTNLLSKGETIGNEFVFIDGITFTLLPRSENDLLRKAWADLYCAINMEGKANFIKLGSPNLLGGGGGLFGGGQSLVRTPNNQDARSVGEVFTSNGMPSVLDFKYLDDPIVWGPKGKVDSSLQFQLDVTRAITAVGTARAADAANNIAAFTPPAAQTAVSDVDGTFIEAMVVLHSVQIGGRSANR